MVGFPNKTVLLGLLAAAMRGVTAVPSFRQAVVRGGARRAHLDRYRQDVNDELLSKAIPVEQYEAMRGVSLGINDNNADGNPAGRRLEEWDVDYEYMYSFSGYSLRYAKCQPVQYFSENAVQAGEYSPMVTEDIVVLRLCPQQTCSESSAYGCYYNYADYALTLTEYVKIMLRYSAAIREYTCEWCRECEEGGNNNNNQNQNNNNNNNNRELEDNYDEQADEAEAQDEYDNGQQEKQNNGAYYCNEYNDYCYKYDCDGGNDQGDDNNNNNMDYEEYLDYMECAEVNYNDYAYFVRPRCDASGGGSGTFKMEVYYDNYCIQYAGGDVSVKDMGLGFQEDIFEPFYTTTCVECSEAVSFFQYE